MIDANTKKSWSSLMKPSSVDIQEKSANTSVVKISPLERGFALTLGNALRRVLLSSIQGAGIVALKIEGVEHEFATISGVREDVVDIMLNVKSIVVKYEEKVRKKLTLSALGPCEVTAGMISAPEGVEIVNKDLVICHLDKGVKFNIELFVESGVGYFAPNGEEVHDQFSAQLEESLGIGVIPVDTVFSPVVSVSYKADHARVGSETEFDKLQMEIKTNGSITPKLAVGMAARILKEQLSVFSEFEPKSVAEIEKKNDTELEKWKPEFFIKVEDLELSVRSHNCLRNENMRYVGDITAKTEAEMLKTPNFGRKSLNEITHVLTSLGLSLGMDMKDWPPENIEELSKSYSATATIL